jgi:hypothetical protein
MSNIISFPPIKPPFLEVGPEHVDGYSYVIRFRDAKFRPMLFRRCSSRREALAYARDYGGYPILQFAGAR